MFQILARENLTVYNAFRQCQGVSDVCRSIIVCILIVLLDFGISVMSSNDILVRLRYLDAYPKTLEDFRIKTYGGAAGK